MAEIIDLGGITVEYKLAPKMVLCSHGFGVRRDGRGIFTGIAKELPAGYGYVLFDYYDHIPGSALQITTFNEQIERFKTVLVWLQQQPQVKSVSVVGHSMGCIVTSLVKPEGLKSVILLAPPMWIGDHSRQYFTGKMGAELRGSEWYIPRSDGSITIIPASWFDEIEQIDSRREIADYASQMPLTIVVAGADQVLQEANYSLDRPIAGASAVVIPEATHDFSGEARPKLIKAVIERL